jgi:hypothetical protein
MMAGHPRQFTMGVDEIVQVILHHGKMHGG